MDLFNMVAKGAFQQGQYNYNNNSYNNTNQDKLREQLYHCTYADE